MVDAIADWETHKNSKSSDCSKLSHRVGRIICHAMVASGYFDSSMPSLRIMNESVEYHRRGKKALRAVIKENSELVDEAHELKEKDEKIQKGRVAGGKSTGYSKDTIRAFRIEARATQKQHPNWSREKIAQKILDELTKSRQNRETKLIEKYHLYSKPNPSVNTVCRKWLTNLNNEALDPKTS